MCAFFVALHPVNELSAMSGPAAWEGEVASYEKRDSVKAPRKGGIVFIGSSSIRLWATLQKDFPEHNVINRGIGGSQIADAVYFADRLVVPHEPRMVIFYSGANDINAGRTAEQVAAGFQSFVEKVRTALPEVEIAFVSIGTNPSRAGQLDTVRKANALAAAYCQKLPRMQYIDVFSSMLDSAGRPRRDIFLEDQLHLNAEGYKLWREIIRPHLGPPDSER